MNAQPHLISELSTYAAIKLNELKSHISESDIDKTSILMNVVRYFDTNFILSKFSSEELDFDKFLHNYFIFHGYLPALSFLLCLTKDSLTLGLTKSSDASRSFAMTFLHQIGRTRIFLRHLNLAKSGMMEASLNNDIIIFKKTERGVGIELLDSLEDNNLNNVMINYFGDKNKPKKEMPTRLSRQMHDLVFAWRKNFIGYDTTPEIDEYFLKETIDFSKNWNNFAGIRPDFRFGPIKGKDLILVSIALLSFYMKHLSFCFEYIKKFPGSEIDNILTIWTEKKVLIESISEFASLPRKNVYNSLKLLSVNAKNIGQLANSYKSTLPCLIDINRRLSIRPVSSLFYDPLFFSAQELRLNNQKIWDRNTIKREDIFRNDLYGLFFGNRYITSSGAAQLKGDGRIYTDIDAAVIDVETKTLALFELKWHEPFGDNESERLSRAINLKRGIKKWLSSVRSFIERFGIEELARQIFQDDHNFPQLFKVKFFVLARHHARFSGVSFQEFSASVFCWKQFKRMRLELGPVDDTFESLAQDINPDMEFSNLNLRNKPIRFTVGKYQVVIEDSFFSMDD